MAAAGWTAAGALYGVPMLIVSALYVANRDLNKAP